MKKRMFIVMLLSAFMAIVVACEKSDSKELNLKVAPYEYTIFKGDTKSFSFQIENETDHSDYFVSYSICQGEGTLSDENWNVLELDSLYDIPGSEFLIHYTAHSSGDQRIMLNVHNKTGWKKELIIDLVGK